MRKFDAYAMFREEMRTCASDPLMSETCLQEAVKHKDVDFIDQYTNFHTESEWYEMVISLERKGVKAIPNYVWDEVVNYMTDWADYLCEEAEKTASTAPETEEDALLREKIEKCEKERDELPIGTLEWRIKRREANILNSQKKHTLNLPIDLLADVRLINANQFLDEYFGGAEPKTFDELHAALRDMAKKIRNYAKMLSDAE